MSEPVSVLPRSLDAPVAREAGCVSGAPCMRALRGPLRARSSSC